MTIPQVVCPVCGVGYIMNPSDYEDGDACSKWITAHLRGHTIGEMLDYFEMQMAKQYWELKLTGGHGH